MRATRRLASMTLGIGLLLGCPEKPPGPVSVPPAGEIVVDASPAVADGAAVDVAPPPKTAELDAAPDAPCDPKCQALREASEFGMVGFDPTAPGLYYTTLASYADAGVHTVRVRPIVVGRGQLAETAARNLVITASERLNRCYDAGLRNNPSLRGNVGSVVVVDASGHVTGATDMSSDMPDTGVTQCVQYVLREIVFPSTPGGARLIVRIAFSP